MKYARACVVSLVILILGAVAAPQGDVLGQRTATGERITLSIVPPTVPADGGSYDIVYVAIMDSRGNPLTVSNKLEVRLSSSTTSVGTVTSSVFIELGSYYAIATFNSTETEGTTTISATTSGYASAQAPVKTVKSTDATPVRLEVIAQPSPLPSQRMDSILIVRPLNSLNLPVVAPRDIHVTLTSSNQNLVSVDPSLTIMEGQSHATAKLKVGHSSGTSTIMASSEGLVPGTVDVRAAGSQATHVKVYMIPPTISTTGIEGGLAVVQLEDSKGTPIRVSGDTEISLISSDDRIVVPKEPIVVIRAGQSFAVASLVPKGVEGRATITPVASGFLSVSAEVTTMKPTFDMTEAKQLMIYSAPPNPNPATTDAVLVVAQVVGKNNAPAPVFRTTKVQLSSSNTDLARFSDDITIVGNDSFGISRLNLVGLSGETTITASAANLQTKQLKISMKGGGSVLDLVPTSNNIPAIKSPYPAFLVMLKSDEIPISAPADINVFISANNDLIDTPAIVQIPRGSSFAVVEITPKGFPGSVTVTARVNGMNPSVKSITLVEMAPTMLQVFTPFPTLLPTSADGDPLVIVQLQNSKEAPAKNMVSDTEVSLSVIPSTVGTVQQMLIIPKGENFAVAKVFLSTVQTDGTVSATAEGFKLVTARFKTMILPLDLTVFIQPTQVEVNQTATVTARVTSEGRPVPNAPVKWNYNPATGTLIALSDVTNAAGEAMAVFTPTQDVPQQVTASVAKPGYTEMQRSVRLGDVELVARPQPFSFDLLSIILISAIAAQGFVIYMFYQKKRPLF